ncbi:hypothetical protein [Halalkalicoccus subterraneus]|uniref:hypothetical protein n=1 Tax=Halalkalicoccus subterraneus TaxID=2675002 RepID=UPI0013CE99C8|nr:hypothetical protein [Halalkalicoccus subterraneus]
MSRDTSIRSFGDRVDASLILWWAALLVAGVVAVGGAIDVLFLDLGFVGPGTTLMAWAYIFDRVRKSIGNSPLQDMSEGVRMSRTVSFRPSEQLDEFLGQEVERHLMTKSDVAQMFVAEQYRQLQEDQEEEEVSAVDKINTEEEDSSDSESDKESPSFERHSDSTSESVR